MKHRAIISRGESLQILKNYLRKAALEKHAAQLASATAGERQRIMAQIDKGIEGELRRRIKRIEPGNLIH